MLILNKPNKEKRLNLPQMKKIQVFIYKWYRSQRILYGIISR